MFPRTACEEHRNHELKMLEGLGRRVMTIPCIPRRAEPVRTSQILEPSGVPAHASRAVLQLCGHARIKHAQVSRLFRPSRLARAILAQGPCSLLGTVPSLTDDPRRESLHASWPSEGPACLFAS